MENPNETPQEEGAATQKPSRIGAGTPLERLNQVKQYIADGTMISGEDYGVPPGSQSKKPCLYKAGAQKICLLFDLAPIVKEKERFREKDLISYEVTYQIVDKTTGIIHGEGVGECNSKERKYKSQDMNNIANTLLKMAGKRGMIDATLYAFGISSLFTQDLEDGNFDGTPETEQRGRSQSQGNRSRGKQTQASDAGLRIVKDIPRLSNPNLRGWIEYAKGVPNHPQIAALRAEFERRKAEFDARNAPPDTRFREWEKRSGQGAGFAAFMASAANAGLSFLNDLDIVDFQKAAAEKADGQVILEACGDEDLRIWSQLIDRGDFRWGE